MIDVENQSVESEPVQTQYGAKIRKLILERCGLFFRDHEHKGLDTAVCTRMAVTGISDYETYFRCLTDSQDEFCELLNLLTVRHTYFFRNEPQFAALHHTVLPAVIERKRQSTSPQRPTLTLWSAGCATGEEPYSLAMAVYEALPDLDQWDVSILATDVSTHALAGAQTGMYRSGSMQLVSERDRTRFFTEKRDPAGKHRYLITEPVRRLVRFSYLNLLEDPFPQSVDVIFCRNVMIYFDQAIVTQLVKRFYDSLARPGYLFIGYSESLQSIQSDFKLTMSNEGIYYRKIQLEKTWKAKTVADTPAEAVTPTSEKTHSMTMLERILEAVIHKDYDRALDLIMGVDAQSPHAVEAYYQAAFIYTNQGAYSRAQEWLDKILTLDPLFAPAYFLLGTLYLEEADCEQAQAALKKAVYLDPGFPMAHMALATAYCNQDRPHEAIREYQRAIKIVSTQTPEQEVPHAGGFDHGTLLSICYNNIERLQHNL